jgi:hypothetical protein
MCAAVDCEALRRTNYNLGELSAPGGHPAMQILHPFAGSVQQYLAQLDDPDQHRPACCPQCQAKDPLTAHGFYTRTIIDAAFDGSIRVRRYLCEACRRTVSLLPEFALPYLRSSLAFIAWWFMVRFVPAAPPAPTPPPMPYQRGQFWLRRFRAQAEALCAALAALTIPAPAPNFVQRALAMLTTTGWTEAHRFLFTDLRLHLLGWPPSLAPDGRRLTLPAVPVPA